MTGFRLEKGGVVDRTRPLRFSFDGLELTGHPGDTLASALIANGVSLVGRSFKYHRPRGVFTAGSSEPNALVELRSGNRREPNTRATMIELYEGLDARSQNRWPSLRFDIGAINQVVSPLLVAGFYYKTFMWPAALWEKLYEPQIRRAAGLGYPATGADPDRYEKAHAHCDILVIGAGPAGLMAALSAARAGARVLIADEHPSPGGSLLGEREEIAGRSDNGWVKDVVAELTSLPGVTILPRTTVFGWYDGNTFGCVERVSDHCAIPGPGEPRQRLWRVQARTAILAAGAEERPIVFSGNDRPGVMQASAIRAYANRYGVAVGRSVVVFTNNDSGYRTARDLAHAGVNVEAVLDSRTCSSGGDAGGADVLGGAVILSVNGQRSVNSIEVLHNGARRTIHCDAVAVSGGWSPILNLACQRGARPLWDERIAAFVPPPGGTEFLVAGAAAGEMTLLGSLRDGSAKGASAATSLGFSAAPAPVPLVEDEAYRVTPLWAVDRSLSRGKAFVDYQNDVTAEDVALSAREGYVDVEQTKRYTTLGMATDQGKLSNLNGLALLAEATGRTIAEIGTTTFRPFYTPVSFGALAGPFVGRHFQPMRKSPLHDWCVEHDAVFVEAGLWLRPAWFPKVGETSYLDSVNREVVATRTGVGVCDVSTLGKIDLQGPDVVEFLNRLYCNGWSTLPVGKARYGLMLREDGIVFDDGTVSRLRDNHFFMTTTTGNASAVLSHIEFCHQVLWPDLDVQYVAVTDQWAQLAIAGPKARATLQKILDEPILGEGAFPYLAAQATEVLGGIPARLFRISFSGEHAYELSVPADFGDAAMRALILAGEEFGIVPYGIEALSVMRIEKGHVAGAELNGTTTAADLGLGRMMSRKKDYIGRAMASREGLLAGDRECLTGIRSRDRKTHLRAGSHILPADAEPSLENTQGHITSVAFSPTLANWIGLALVKRGASRHGEVVQVYDAIRGRNTLAELCDPVQFDPQNEKLHA